MTSVGSASNLGIATMPGSPALDVSWANVGVTLGGSGILNAVNLKVAAGSWLALLGPNGAGKTTLLRTLAGGVDYSGTVCIGKTDLAESKPAERAKRLAVVPQHPEIPVGFRVVDYVLLGRTPYQGIRFSPSLSDHRKVGAVLHRLDILDFAERTVSSLSGGERQRVVIARALVQETPVLALDEPTAFLDAGHQLELLELIDELRTQQSLTIISTIHDLSVAGQFADTVAVLSHGELVASGSPAQVLTEQLIATHWGVQADVSVDAEGQVAISVRRRSRSRKQPMNETTTEALTNGEPS